MAKAFDSIPTRVLLGFAGSLLIVACSSSTSQSPKLDGGSGGAGPAADGGSPDSNTRLDGPLVDAPAANDINAGSSYVDGRPPEVGQTDATSGGDGAPDLGFRDSALLPPLDGGALDSGGLETSPVERADSGVDASSTLDSDRSSSMPDSGGEVTACTIAVDGGFLDPILGNFDSPQVILDNPTVAAALTAVQALSAGSSFQPSLLENPPDVSGRITVAANSGSTLATSSKTDVGRVLAGYTSDVSVVCPGVLQSNAITTVNGTQVISSTSRSYVRGSGLSYTTYAVVNAVCTEQGSSFNYEVATIEIGTLNAAGTSISFQALNVTLATSGTLTTACANRLIGSLETQGSWVLVQDTATRAR